MNNIYKYAIAVGVTALAMYFIMKGQQEYVEVPVEIEVPIPVVKVEFDTIKLPAEVIKLPGEKTVDSSYYKKYMQLKTFIEKDSAYKEAITIREYEPVFEDDTIIIKSYNKVRGTLLQSKVSYQTKPRSIQVDTVLKVKIPKKPILMIGGGVLLPTQTTPIQASPSIEAGFMFINKKHNKSFNATYDPVNKVFGVGMYFKL